MYKAVELCAREATIGYNSSPRAASAHRWCAEENAEGGPDERPTRGRPIWITYSSRLSSESTAGRPAEWREVHPVVDPVGPRAQCDGCADGCAVAAQGWRTGTGLTRWAARRGRSSTATRSSARSSRPPPANRTSTPLSGSSRLSALSFFHSESVLYRAFVWARRALNSQKRRLPARGADQEVSLRERPAVLAHTAARRRRRRRRRRGGRLAALAAAPPPLVDGTSRLSQATGIIQTLPRQ